jgi:hypothetical protein
MLLLRRRRRFIHPPNSSFLHSQANDFLKSDVILMVVAGVVIWGVYALVMRMCRVRLVFRVLSRLPCGRLSVLTEVVLCAMEIEESERIDVNNESKGEKQRPARTKSYTSREALSFLLRMLESKGLTPIPT